VPFNDTRGDWSQRNQRNTMQMQDQHGRPWFATIEIKTGDPCGLIEAQFQAPLVPPQEYLRRVPRKPYDLHIDYTAWKQDIRTARADWEREGRQLARKLHGSAYDPRKAFSIEVLEMIGEAPSAIEPVIAAEQGNSWVLGLTSTVDMRLVQFFEPEQIDPDYSTEPEGDFREALEDQVDPNAEGGKRVAVRPKAPRSGQTPWQQFVAEQMKQGKSMKQASEAYKARQNAA